MKETKRKIIIIISIFLISMLIAINCAVFQTTTLNIAKEPNSFAEKRIVKQDNTLNAPANSHSQNEIIVSGNGKIKVNPEIAKIRFSVCTQAENLADANTQQKEKIENIKATLSDFTITTTYFSTYPIYDYQNGKILQSYEICNNFEILTENFSMLNTIIDNLQQSGATSIENIEYTLKDDTQAYNEALSVALNNAIDKAQTLSLAQNAEIKIKEICEQGYFYNPYIKSVQTLELRNETENENGTLIISPNEIEINATITVKFSIDYNAK
ncbi:MAG: SIMPL domain-containing protein [Christensenellales bacterium]